VLIAGRLIFITGDIYGVNKQNYYKFVANDMNQEFIDPVAFAYTGETKRPFSPVHCIHHGNRKYTWTRRNRVGLELTSNAHDIPLGEAYERYSVKLFSNSGLVTQYFTMALEITIDKGIAMDQMRICQLSDAVGEGASVSHKH